MAFTSGSLSSLSESFYQERLQFCLDIHRKAGLSQLLLQPFLLLAKAAPRATGSGLPGRHWGVTRHALLLDVKEALVDEFVDAEGA